MLHILPSRSPYGKRFRARWQMLILAISRVCDAVDFTRSNGRYLGEADNWNRGIWAKAGERWQELTCERPIRVQGLVQPIFGITFHPQFNEFSKTRCVRDQLSQRCRNMRSDLRSRWNFQ
jgi:hypothetical protein